MGSKRRWVLVIAAATVALAAPTTSQAAWQPPMLVDAGPSYPGGFAMTPQVVVAPDGTATVVNANQRTTDWVDAHSFAFGAVSPGANSMLESPAYQLASTSAPTLIGEDSSGNVTALWLDFPPAGGEAIVAGTRVAGSGTWSNTRIPPAGQFEDPLSFAEAPDGTAAVLMEECSGQGPGSTCYMGVSVRAAGTSTWSTHTESAALCADLVPGHGTVSIGTDDTVVGAWSQEDVAPGGSCGSTETAYSSSLDTGSSAWSDQTLPLASATALGAVKLAVDSHGTTRAVYMNIPGAATNGPQELVESDRTTGGSWSAPVVIAGTPTAQIGGTSGEDSYLYLSMQSDGSDNLTMTWVGIDSSTSTAAVEVARKPAGGAWGAAHSLYTGGIPDPLLLSVDPSGAAAVGFLYFDYTAQTYQFVVATSTASGVWSAPTTAFTLNNQGQYGISLAYAAGFGPVVAYALSDLSGTTPTVENVYVTWDPINAPPTNSSLPTISGTAQQGQVLTEQHGTWNPTPSSYRYQWEQCSSAGSSCAAIAGATAQAYTPAAGDVGHTVRVQEWATSAGATGGPANSAATPVIKAGAQPPSNNTAPTITGTAAEGQLLTEHHGGWSGNPTSYSYQWERCNSSGCGAIASATAQTYSPTQFDVGSTIQVEEWAANIVGTGGPATSVQTATVVGAIPTFTQPPVVSGLTEQGQGLSEQHGSWSNNPQSYSYVWEDCDSAGANCTPIPSSDAQLYTLAPSDVGHTIRVEEFATNLSGTGGPDTSAATSVVVGPIGNHTPPHDLTPPSISGTPKISQPLGSSTGTWTGTPPLQFSYQWQRCRPSCVDIAGATGRTYAVTTADSGALIRLVVSARNSAGSATANSAMVGPVPSGGSGPTRQQVKSALSTIPAPAGKQAKIESLLKHGSFTSSFAAPSAGRLVIKWYERQSGRHTKPSLIAAVTVIFSKAGEAKFKIGLTAKGKRLLRHAKNVKVIAKDGFTPLAESLIETIKHFTLKR